MTPPTRRDGVTLTLTLATKPQYLAQALALALDPNSPAGDQTITMNLTAVMSEVIARFITMIEETPCQVLITDVEASLL
jgi:hypothetical protein